MAGPFAKRNGEPRGLRPRLLDPAVIGDAFALGERLADGVGHLADRLEAIHREELRGDMISRVETAAPPAGGGLAEVAVVPSAGAVWTEVIVQAAVLDCAADRNVALYLGGIGDRSRPLARITAASAAEGVGGTSSQGQIGPFSTNRGVYGRFLALAAGEVATLHIVARELIEG